MVGPGLPAYSSGRLDDDVGHAAPPSFRFDVQGGSVGYEYAHTDMAIFPDCDYLLEGYIRADGLEYARAFIACYFVDRFGQRIAGSEHVSRLVPAGPGAERVWERVEIPLPSDYPAARAVHVQLWVLQCHVWRDPDGRTPDPIIRQDVRARVWFDDITIYRMPRVRFGLSRPGGVIDCGGGSGGGDGSGDGGEGEYIEFDAHNATLATAHAEVRILDDRGGECFGIEFDVLPRASESRRILVPALGPGLYRATVRLVAAGETLLERTIRFVVLPELDGPVRPDSGLGIDLGRWPGGDETGAGNLITALDVGAVKIGVPMFAELEDEEQANYLRQIRDLARHLARGHVRTTGVILAPEAQGDPDEFPATWQMVASSEDWSGAVGEVFAYFGGYLLSWQLGHERSELRSPNGWTDSTVREVRETLERFVAAPELVLPRSVFDAQPSSPFAGVVVDEGFSSGPPPPAKWLQACSFWLPAEVPARLFPWQLAFWFDDPTGGDSPAGGGDDSGVERWLSLELDRSTALSAAERLADTARRIALAKAVNPARLYIPAPFDASSDGGGTIWQPTAEYIPLRTLFHHLSGQRAVASLDVGDDVVGLLFGDGNRHTLIVWTWQGGVADQTIELYAGTKASALELTGTAVPLERDGQRVRIPLSPMPLIVMDVDAALLQLQSSFRVVPAHIQLHSPEPVPVLMFRNHYAADLAGTIRLQPPAMWAVRPNPLSVEAAPGQLFEQPLYFDIPPRQIASEQILGVDVQLTHPEPLNLHFDVPLQVSLRDIVVRASAWWNGSELVVEQSLRNLSDVAVSFSSFCQAADRPQSESVFLNVLPGEVRTLEYRFPASRDLAEGRLWLGIEEIDGPRTLDQLVAIPR